MKASGHFTSFRSTRFWPVAISAAVCTVAGVVALVAGEEEPKAAEPAAPLVPRIGSRDYEEGGYVYERNCVVCHGTMGDGRGEMAAALGIKPCSFRSGLFKYRSTPWGKLPTKTDLERTVRGGITGTAMGMFTQLSDTEVSSVVEYLKIFSRKWRKPENYAEPVALPAPPAWLVDNPERDRHGSSGKQTFQAVCATCHGTDGAGQGPAAAALKDDMGAPIVPADLRQAHLRSGDDPADLFRVLMTGLNGTPMVSFAEAFSEEQKWDLVAYILTLRHDFNAPDK